MYKTLASCACAIAVMAIVTGMVWKTLRNEAASSNRRQSFAVFNRPGSSDPVQAFTSTGRLADYLIAAAQGDAKQTAAILASPASVTLDGGTRVDLLGISGPGQAKIKVTSGKHLNETLFVSYAVIREVGT